jgi:hypothetical protein
MRERQGNRNVSSRVKLRFRDECNTKELHIVDAFEFAQRVSVTGAHPPKSASSSFWFRGQGDISWPLKPSIGREHKFWGEGLTISARRLLIQEYDLLHRFRKYAHAFFQRELTPWEAITCAQHHGLPTRLLDWTSNPLVGLYFAAKEYVSGRVARDGTGEARDGAVFACRQRVHIDGHLNVYDDGKRWDVHIRDPLMVRGIKVVPAMMSTQRIVAQSGFFTIQDPKRSLEEQNGVLYSDRDLDLYDMIKWRVPATYKPNILRQLERIGINERTLFPDLDGVGRGMLRTEILRSKPGRRSHSPLIVKKRSLPRGSP